MGDEQRELDPALEQCASLYNEVGSSLKALHHQVKRQAPTGTLYRPCKDPLWADEVPVHEWLDREGTRLTGWARQIRWVLLDPCRTGHKAGAQLPSRFLLHGRVQK